MFVLCLVSSARGRATKGRCAVRLDVRPIQCRSALNRVRGMPFKWSLNPYRGCSHACWYCYARQTHTYFDLDGGRDFERIVFAKVNVAERLRAQIQSPRWKRETVAVGAATDPYQPVEGRLKLTRACLREFLAARSPVSLITKSTLLRRDGALLQDLARAAGVSVTVSIPIADANLARRIEPGTPPPDERFRLVAELARLKLDVGVNMAPVLPGLTDSNAAIEAVMRRGARPWRTARGRDDAAPRYRAEALVPAQPAAIFPPPGAAVHRPVSRRDALRGAIGCPGLERPSAGTPGNGWRRARAVASARPAAASGAASAGDVTESRSPIPPATPQPRAGIAAAAPIRRDARARWPAWCRGVVAAGGRGYSTATGCRSSGQHFEKIHAACPRAACSTAGAAGCAAAPASSPPAVGGPATPASRPVPSTPRGLSDSSPPPPKRRPPRRALPPLQTQRPAAWSSRDEPNAGRQAQRAEHPRGGRVAEQRWSCPSPRGRQPISGEGDAGSATAKAPRFVPVGGAA